MHEALFFMIGFLIGGMFGVVLMCLLQVNRVYRIKEEHENE